MQNGYIHTRDRLEQYFDRTAASAWERLTSDAPVSRIRQTVREGRDRMRTMLLDQLPPDLHGARVLDAGCGAGQMSVELAARGADVVAVDISPRLLTIARERTPDDLYPRIEYLAGDMLDPHLGTFDFVVAMDSLVHYRTDPYRRRSGRAVPAHRRRDRLHRRTADAAPRRHASRRQAFPARRPFAGDRAAGCHRAGAEGIADVRPPTGNRRAGGHGLLHLPGDGAASMRVPRVPLPKLLRAPIPVNRLSIGMLPFADAASDELPLGQLLRLSLFQVSVGMATVMLLGTLNRVMIVELGVPAGVVAAMIALPVLSAPFRALLGFRSDTHRSAIGWKRVPYIWFGSLWQFGGLAIMPFSLIVLSGDQTLGPPWAGEVLAGLAFLMTGLGMHMTQTAGLALACDRATEETRPRVVALLYVMFLVGMGISALVVGTLLADFSNLRLIRVVQGTAVATLLLNLVALWKQERMTPMTAAERATPRPSFAAAWADYASGGKAGRLLGAVALGTAAFSMQDVLLEPYGGQVLGLSVSETTLLTAIWAVGAIAGFALGGPLAGSGHESLSHGRTRAPCRHRGLHLRDLRQSDGFPGAVLRGRGADRQWRRSLRRGHA